MSYWQEELARTYRQYQPMLYRLAFAYMKNRADSEDLVHDCFVKLLVKERHFRSAEHEKAWLITVLENLTKDKLKQKSRTELDFSDFENYLASTQDESTHEILRTVLTLPERLILPVYLFYYEGYQTGEIAQILRRNPSTVRNQLSEARQRLRHLLEVQDEK